MRRTLENNLPFPMPRPSKVELLERLYPNHPETQLLYGYLGADEELDRLIVEDEETMERLALTYEDLASTIEYLFQSSDERISGNLIIRDRYIHSPVCPWGDFCTIEPFDFNLKVTQIFVLNKDCPCEVVDRFNEDSKIPLEDYPALVDNDWAMIFSDLHPHLIREHQFLEGRGTPYRVDPERAIRYLGMK